MAEPAVARYVAAYDVERSSADQRGPAPSCLEACRTIARVHREYDMPATFFLVGKVLERDAAAYRDLLDDPLFEPASHSYSHRLFADHPICGSAAPPEAIREEVLRGKDAVERVFEGECLGLRTACGFPDGLAGRTEVLEILAGAGLRYVSSCLWGPDYSLPAPLRSSWCYTDEGFPGLREYPAHGWHENLLKGNNRVFGGQPPLRILLFPPPYPDAIPRGFVRTPEEEFAVNNRVFLDAAVRENAEYVSLVWHPWSLAMFDPDMRMLRLTFERVLELGLAPSTFASLHGEQP